MLVLALEVAQDQLISLIKLRLTFKKINLFVGKHALFSYFRYCSNHRMKIKLKSDFYVLMLIKNFKQMNVQIIRQTDKKTHTDSPMIGIMTEREHRTKSK